MFTAESFFELHHSAHNATGCTHTPFVTDLIRAKMPVVFTKFGDGEYLCMDMQSGKNCDGDKFTKELGHALCKAFRELCEMAAVPHPTGRRIFLGKWHYAKEVRFMCQLYYTWQQEQKRIDDKLHEIPFVNYHLIYNDENFDKNANLFEFVKVLQDDSRHKLLISNPSLQRLSLLFKTAAWINIPATCWHTVYDKIEAQVREHLLEHPDTIVFIAGGLASKVLIANMTAAFPLASFLDIGSGFDLLGKGHRTRSQAISYPQMIAYYKDLLPSEWQ